MGNKLSFVFVCIIFTSSCATAPGKIKEHEMEWSKFGMSINYQAAYRNLAERFRKCPGYHPIGDLYTDIKGREI